MDYADQRSYWSMTGSLVTADPADKDRDVTDPGSWNGYVHVQGNPGEFGSVGAAIGASAGAAGGGAVGAPGFGLLGAIAGA